MVIFEKNKDKIGSKYTIKHTSCTVLKFFLGRPCSRTHLAMRSMWLCDMQISKSEKKNLAPLPNPGDAPVLCQIGSLVYNAMLQSLSL